VKHRDVVLWLLGPADENAAEAVHPTVSALHYPAPCLASCLAFQLFRLFSFWWNVCRESKLLGEFLNFLAGISFIETQVLLFVRAGRGAFDWNAFQGFFGHFHVGTVRPIHGDAQWNAVALDQQAALGALLGPIGGVFPCLFSPRGVPWSCTRPYSAIPSLCPSSSHTPRVRSSRVPGIHHRRPTPGTDHGPWNQGRTSSHPVLSTGNPCAGRRKSRSCTRDRACVADHPQSDACSRAQASAWRSRSRDHPGCTNRRKRCRASWLALRKGRPGSLAQTAAAYSCYSFTGLIG
jgi:hypothetical protein